MKCQEVERRIYLYQELSDRERKETDMHLTECSACSAIMERVNATHNLIASQRNKIHPMNNEAQMTRRIMNAVEKTGETKMSLWEILLQRIALTPLRHGMAALSFFLLMFFLSEYANDGRNLRIVKMHRGDPGKKTELNLASFHSAFLAARENTGPSSKLIWACVENCVHSQAPDCGECADKFMKP